VHVNDEDVMDVRKREKERAMKKDERRVGGLPTY
jgi:hypothetical protein